MGRPRTKSDAVLQEQFKKLDAYQDMNPQLKREEKRVWKKQRTKHLRTESKKDMRRIEDDFHK